MFLDVNGVRLHALVFGDGPRTLVAVGGWTGSWEVWAEPIAQLTARGWRCVAYDHRGAGESPVEPTRITVGGMVDDVGGVLDALGVERCVLAGESQGGAIAQYAVARSPHRFEGLVARRTGQHRPQRGRRRVRRCVSGRLPGGGRRVRQRLFPRARLRPRQTVGEEHPLACRAGASCSHHRDVARRGGARRGSEAHLHPDLDPPRNGRRHRPDRRQPSTRSAPSGRRARRVRGHRPRADDDATYRGRRRHPPPFLLTLRRRLPGDSRDAGAVRSSLAA